MILGIAAVISGFVLGSIRGGSARRLLELRPRSVVWLALGLVLVLATRLGFGGDSGALLAAGLLALVVAAVRNLQVPGTGVVAVGLGTNALSVLLNGSTPVDPRALDAAGVSVFDPTPTQHLAGPDTLLPLLGGAIPVPAPGLVISFGDLIIATGLVALVSGATVSRSRTVALARTGTSARTSTSIPVGEILDSGPLRIVAGSDDEDSPESPTVDLTTLPPTVVPARGRRQRPSEVGQGETADIPLCWGPPDRE